MNILKTTLRLLRRGLIWLLVFYWVIFVGYTVKLVVTGGPSAVVAWYEHITGPYLQWSWRVFFIQHGAILAVTVVLCLFGRRHDSGVSGKP
jgi:hypothetical protein